MLTARLLLLRLLWPLLAVWALLRLLVLLPWPRRIPPYALLRLRGSLPWRRVGPRLSRRTGPTIEDVEKLLAALAKEPSVRGVVLRVEELRISVAKREALREALRAFRESGREVVVYWKQATASDFFLASVADRIYLAPGGILMIVGYAATLTGLRPLLDRVGLQPDFVRAGRYKTAPELFTEREPSPEQREFVETVLDHRYQQLVRDVAARKGGDEAWAREVIDGGPYTSQRAVDAGLVDALVYPDELPERLVGEDADPAARARPLVSAQQLVASRRWRFSGHGAWPKGRVAVIQLSGLIMGGGGSRWPMGPSVVAERNAVALIDRVRRESSIRAVVLTIDSRGGLASAAELIRRAVWRLAEAKPTVAYVEQVAASGGYLIASAARRIIAGPGSLVGSIGAFSGRMGTRELFERLGIHQEVLLRGANAGMLEAAHPLGENERRAMEAELAQVYEDFVAKVAEGRRQPVDAIRACAEGRVFLAEQAPEALVDEVGDFRRALAWVCGEARLDPGRVALVALGRQRPRLPFIPLPLPRQDEAEIVI